MLELHPGLSEKDAGRALCLSFLASPDVSAAHEYVQVLDVHGRRRKIDLAVSTSLGARPVLLGVELKSRTLRPKNIVDGLAQAMFYADCCVLDDPRLPMFKGLPFNGVFAGVRYLLEEGDVHRRAIDGAELLAFKTSRVGLLCWYSRLQSLRFTSSPNLTLWRPFERRWHPSAPDVLFGTVKDGGCRSLDRHTTYSLVQAAKGGE
jgi:hypothetical protein